jgi:hypothetical protein
MVRPYEICIDGYYHMSGGVRALHVLKQEILNRGIDAWMKYESKNNLECIGIYPEIFSSNPQNYQRICRWLLNTADLPEDGPIFAWESGMGDYPLLTVNIIELDLWKPYHGHREGVGYWIGKGIKDVTLIPEGAIEISRNNFVTRQELAEKIKTLDYFISFDAFTALNVEAALCGTPVLIYGDHKKITKEQTQKHNWTPHGISWGENEMDRARKEVNLAYDHYLSLLPEFSRRIDNFIEYTQNYYN